MILLIGKEEKELKNIIEESKLSNMGVWERKHLESWIAERPEILGEELLTITTEYSGFDKTSKRLDILAVDREGKLVIIELKRDMAEKFIDLQAIHYAAFCSTLTLKDVTDIRAAYIGKSEEEIENEILNFISEESFTDFDNQPRIILVANAFKEETLAAVMWLRDIGADIKCVKLEAYELDDNIVITPDIIIPLPEAENFMIHRETKTKITSTKKIFTEEYHLKNTSEEIKELYSKLKDEIYNLGDDIKIEPKAVYIAFKASTNFVDMEFTRNYIKVWLNLRTGSLNDPENMAKDVSSIGHHGNGDYEINLEPINDLNYLMTLIEQSYNKNS